MVLAIFPTVTKQILPSIVLSNLLTYMTKTMNYSIFQKPYIYVQLSLLSVFHVYEKF